MALQDPEQAMGCTVVLPGVAWAPHAMGTARSGPLACTCGHAGQQTENCQQNLYVVAMLRKKEAVLLYTPALCKTGSDWV